MFIQLTAMIVDADAANREELAGVLRGLGVSVLQMHGDVAELQASLKRGEPPQVVILNLDPSAEAVLDALSGMPRTFPQTAFFGMSQLLDPSLLMRVMAVGLREFIPLPMTEKVLVEALERVSQVHGDTKRARIVNVVPTVGGCGSTTVACNIAASLASDGHRTCLIDLDLIRGGVASYFDVRPNYTVADVMGSADRVDQQLVENALVNHKKTGLHILGRPELPEESQRVTQRGIATLLNVLGRMFDFVIIDSVMSVDPIYASALMSSDATLVVMQLNVPSAKNAERFVGALRRMGLEAARVEVMVNRFVKKGWDIEPGEVERSLGLKINWLIPNDYKSAIAAINYGEPAVVRSPRSEMSVSLREYAQHLSGSRRRAKAA